MQPKENTGMIRYFLLVRLARIGHNSSFAWSRPRLMLASRDIPAFDSRRKQNCLLALARPHKKQDRSPVFYVVRLARIELASRPWQGRILPLNHSRNESYPSKGSPL